MSIYLLLEIRPHYEIPPFWEQGLLSVLLGSFRHVWMPGPACDARKSSNHHHLVPSEVLFASYLKNHGLAHTDEESADISHVVIVLLIFLQYAQVYLKTGSTIKSFRNITDSAEVYSIYLNGNKHHIKISSEARNLHRNEYSRFSVTEFVYEQ